MGILGGLKTSESGKGLEITGKTVGYEILNQSNQLIPIIRTRYQFDHTIKRGSKVYKGYSEWHRIESFGPNKIELLSSQDVFFLACNPYINMQFGNCKFVIRNKPKPGLVKDFVDVRKAVNMAINTGNIGLIRQIKEKYSDIIQGYALRGLDGIKIESKQIGTKEPNGFSAYLYIEALFGEHLRILANQ